MINNPIKQSLEGINFQSGIFHKALTKILEDFIEEKSYTKLDSKMIESLEMNITKCIKIHTNMNIDVNINEYLPCVESPKVDKNNPMIEGYNWDGLGNKTSLSDIRNNSEKQIKGLLDKDKSRVSGYFANMKPINMYVNVLMVDEMISENEAKSKPKTFKMTTKEMAAIILHEVGHTWTYFEFLCRFRTTNQILVATLRELEGSEDHDKREYIIKEAKNALELKNLEIGDLHTKSNTTVFSLLVSNIARKNISQSGVDGYDINSFEALADQFATRHGAGRYLVTGLDKMIKRFGGRISNRNMFSYLFIEALKISLIPLTAIFPYSIILLLITISIDSYHDWYDKDGYRFKRVRNQLIEQLKDSILPKEVSETIREDINYIESISNGYKDRVQLFGLIYDYLIPKGIDKRKQIDFQQKIEELSSNKLFYFANQIKHS